ncbi:hypothetical protein [Jutongia huaianensis]|uniref:Uncharacterized protein n=1 Tax=Jutongia huaianensis TaxID=2763668 RepID=A0ABR7N2I3_9FIRM|nr:hypothetical protein [Jutongia huaianensis]MBC8562223.1 hypothetical protein [Jutongia huaianensis]
MKKQDFKVLKTKDLYPFPDNPFHVAEDLFDISSEQLACVNGAEPGTGLIRFGDKTVPFDNTMEKDSSLYQLFNTNFHEMVKDKNVKQTVEK